MMNHVKRKQPLNGFCGNGFDYFNSSLTLSQIINVEELFTNLGLMSTVNCLVYAKLISLDC